MVTWAGCYNCAVIDNTERCYLGMVMAFQCTECQGNQWLTFKDLFSTTEAHSWKQIILASSVMFTSQITQVTVLLGPHTILQWVQVWNSTSIHCKQYHLAMYHCNTLTVSAQYTIRSAISSTWLCGSVAEHAGPSDMSVSSSWLQNSLYWTHRANIIHGKNCTI